MERLGEPVGQDICCETEFFSISQGSCTHELSKILLPKQDLYTNNTSWRSNVNGYNLTRPHPLDGELQTLSDSWERQSKYSPWVSPLAGDPFLNLGSLIWYQSYGTITDFIISTRIWSKERDRSCLGTSLSACPLCGQNVPSHSIVMSSYEDFPTEQIDAPKQYFNRPTEADVNHVRGV